MSLAAQIYLSVALAVFGGFWHSIFHNNRETTNSPGRFLFLLSIFAVALLPLALSPNFFVALGFFLILPFLAGDKLYEWLNTQQAFKREGGRTLFLFMLVGGGVIGALSISTLCLFVFQGSLAGTLETGLIGVLTTAIITTCLIQVRSALRHKPWFIVFQDLPALRVGMVFAMGGLMLMFFVALI